MAVYIFSLIIIIQLFHMFRGVVRRDRETTTFCVLSVVLTFILTAVIELKLHHFLRNSYGVSNIYVYILTAFLVTAYVWYFREYILNYYYWMLISALGLWVFSGVLDLLTDAGYLIFIHIDIIEEILVITGSLLLLLFYLLLLIKDYFYFYSEST